MILFILSIITGILIVVTILADHKRPLSFYFAKPMTTVTIIAVVLTALPASEGFPAYSKWILAGLGFSLIGDIALMFDSERAFLIGLSSFFVAHSFYLTALWVIAGFDWRDILILLILIGGSVKIYLILKPKLGKMEIPVVFYMIIILLMVERALSAPIGVNKILNLSESVLVATGAVLFWFSDLVLSLHLFHKPNPKVGLMNLIPYFAGQLLIAMSARFVILG